MSDKFNYENLEMRRLFSYQTATRLAGADIKIACEKKKGTLFRMECRPNILKSLEIQGKFTEVPEPANFYRTRGGTVENVAFIDDVESSGVKKVLLELDIATGKATLKAE